MATNLCAECGTRLSRPEYKTHMQQVHGVSVMDDSDGEQHQNEVPPTEGQADGSLPQRSRQRRDKTDADGADETPAADSTQAPTSNGGAPLSDAADADGTKPAGGAGRGPRRSRRPGPQDGKTGDFACSQCDRSFETQQGLARHTQAKHPDSEAAAAVAASAAGGVRRGGRGRGVSPAANGDAPADANGDAPAAARRPRARRTRGGGRPQAAAPTSGAAGTDEHVVAAASAAAAAALTTSPPASGAAPTAVQKVERLVTLFRCKLCEMGFKSKNRARAHVKETHPDSVPAEAAAPEGEAAPAEAAAAETSVPADGQLEVVEVPARRAPRSQARRNRKPAAAAAAANAEGGEGQAARPPPVRRGGRPPKAQPKAAASGDDSVPTDSANGEKAEATSAAPPADELAALGIVTN